MGGCDFSNLVVIKGNASKAYSEACEEMNDYNGHQDGYSGDIQTTHGFSMRSDNPRYGTKSFYKWEEKRLDIIGKRECECIEIKGAVLKRLKESRGLKGRKGIRGFYFYGVAAE